jgi:hypothetical protein
MEPITIMNNNTLINNVFDNTINFIENDKFYFIKNNITPAAALACADTANAVDTDTVMHHAADDDNVKDNWDDSSSEEEDEDMEDIEEEQAAIIIVDPLTGYDYYEYDCEYDEAADEEDYDDYDYDELDNYDKKMGRFVTATAKNKKK